MAFREKYVKLVVALFIIMLIYFNYNLYQEKEMYEEHISIDVSSDISNLVRAIIISNELYNKILDEGNITRYDAERLKMNAYTIQEVSQSYGNLAIKFKRIRSDEFHNESAEQAAQIASFFSKMNKKNTIDQDNMDDMIVELDDKMEEKIIQLKELNALWLDPVKKSIPSIPDKDKQEDLSLLENYNQYGNKSLSQDFWINLVIGIDENTRSFLRKSNLNSINSVLQK